MRVSIHCQRIALTSQDRALIEQRLQFALSRFGRRLIRVRVQLRDMNSIRGGMDKRCQIVARLTGLGELMVQGDDSQLRPLIDRSVERLAHLISRRVEKGRFVRDRLPFGGVA